VECKGAVCSWPPPIADRIELRNRCFRLPADHGVSSAHVGQCVDPWLREDQAAAECVSGHLSKFKVRELEQGSPQRLQPEHLLEAATQDHHLRSRHQSGDAHHLHTARLSSVQMPRSAGGSEGPTKRAKAGSAQERKQALVWTGRKWSGPGTKTEAPKTSSAGAGAFAFASAQGHDAFPPARPWSASVFVQGAPDAH
jgi:hypothetical protein